MSIVTTIARGDASHVVEPRRVLCRTEDEWRALWAIHAGAGTDPPAVDLTTVIVAAAFAGEKGSAGYAIDITAADPAGRTATDHRDPRDSRDSRDHRDCVVTLVVEERAPGPDMIAAAIMTSPFHIVAVSRAAGDVSWVEDLGSRIEGRGSRTEGRASTEGRPVASSSAAPRSSMLDPWTSPLGPRSTTSSTGLEPRTASALAYLAGPFSGALILFAESANQDVRFHAWQSIVGLGGLGIAVIASYTLAFMALFVSATAVSLMVGVATVIWIVLAIVWVLCLWKAWSGQRWKLPLVGDYAERFV